MKSGQLSKFTVKRLSSSPYFQPQFNHLEALNINLIDNVEMHSHDDKSPASILITNTHTRTSEITDQEMAACQLLIHPNSGHDNISPDFIRTASFPIIVGNPIRANAVANFILSTLLSHYSVISYEKEWDKTRKWPRKLLSELTIMIVGHGHIGKILSQSLTPLAREVRIYDPKLGYNNLDLNGVDVLLPVCSLNERNHHFIDSNFLEKLNSDFLLINAARGELVKTDDLLNVLKKKSDAFAYLDVFEKEPADFSLFNHIKNIKLTSHIAGVFKNIDHETIEFEKRIITDFTKMDLKEFKLTYEHLILKDQD